MAATEMVFGTALDFGLKRDIAARMLQFPETLEQRPFLEFALRRLASGQSAGPRGLLRALAGGKNSDRLVRAGRSLGSGASHPASNEAASAAAGRNGQLATIHCQSEQSQACGCRDDRNNLRALTEKLVAGRVTSASGAASRRHRHGSIWICSWRCPATFLCATTHSQHAFRRRFLRSRGCFALGS